MSCQEGEGIQLLREGGGGKDRFGVGLQKSYKILCAVGNDDGQFCVIFTITSSSG